MALFLSPELTVHLGLLKQDEVIARETPLQVIQQRHRLPGLAFAAIKSAEQHLGIHSFVELALVRHLFDGLEATFFVAVESNQEPEHSPGPGQAARPRNHARPE